MLARVRRQHEPVGWTELLAGEEGHHAAGLTTQDEARGCPVFSRETVKREKAVGGGYRYSSALSLT